jgi:hypothetical protein
MIVSFNLARETRLVRGDENRLKAVPHLLPTWLKKFGKVPSEY